MKEVVAFSPGHITGFFQICDQSSDPLLKGSRGSGVSITKGVTTKVRVERAPQMSFMIKINNKKAESAKVSKRVIEWFLRHINKNYRILVDHEVEVPIGSGLGSSGAGALSLALALNKVFCLELSRIKAAQIAHVAEVECKTGLGTVIAETFGGLEIRLKPGAPGIGEIMHIPISDDYVVALLNLGPISTEKSLTNDKLRGQINKLGGELVNELSLHPTPHNFMKFSRSFAENIGMISGKMRKTLIEAERSGFLCSMAMFGESIFSLVKDDSVEEILHIFHKYAHSKQDVIVAKIDFKGARII